VIAAPPVPPGFPPALRSLRTHLDTCAVCDAGEACLTGTALLRVWAASVAWTFRQSTIPTRRRVMPDDDLSDDDLFDQIADLGTLADAARDTTLPPAIQDAAQSAAASAAANLADQHKRD
jgi:hypothetical protein